MPFTRADNTCCITARQFSAIQHSFENTARFGWQSAKPNLFFRPENDARAEPLWLDKAFHERDLIDAHPQKESREFGQRFFAEVVATIKFVPPGSIAIGK